MSQFVTEEEYARRITCVSLYYPQYCHKFPLNMWAQHLDGHESGDRLIAYLARNGVRGKYLYLKIHHPWHSGDYFGVSLITNCDQEQKENTVVYSTDIYLDAPVVNSLFNLSACYYPILRAPTKMGGLRSFSEIPHEQILLLSMLFPNPKTKITFFQNAYHPVYSWPPARTEFSRPVVPSNEPLGKPLAHL